MVRAIRYEKTGGPEVWEFVTDHVVRPREPGEVRVAVKSSSYNPIDRKIRNGVPGRPLILPKVPGGDLAGVVIESDPESKFKKGDVVFAHTPGTRGDETGTWTEEYNVKEEILAFAPSNIPIEEVGSIPAVAITAFQALESANIKPGDRVLVHGGSGGVGHVAVQLAKNHYKAHVVSTSRNVDFLKKIGADEVLDYSKEDFVEKYKDQPFDVIVDDIGLDTELRSYDLVKKGGTYAHIRATGTSIPERYEEGKKWTDKKYTFTIARSDANDLRLIAKLIEDGKLKVYIADSVPLERIQDAEELNNNKKFGKIAITI